MSLVGNDYYIASICQLFIHITTLRLELLYRRKYHATRCHAQQRLQMLSVLRLYRRLSQQLTAVGECSEQLVVQVVTVGYHHNGRIAHRADNLANIKHHRKRLARTLRMPYHARLMVTLRLFFHIFKTIYGRIFFQDENIIKVDAGGTHCRFHRFVHSIILMICSDLLHRLYRSDARLFILRLAFFEYRERTDKVEQCLLVQHSLYQHLHLTDQSGCFSLTIGTFPCHHATEAG